MKKIDLRAAVFTLLIAAFGGVVGFGYAVRLIAVDLLQCKASSACRIPGLDDLTIDALRRTYSHSGWMMVTALVLIVLFHFSRPRIGLTKPVET